MPEDPKDPGQNPDPNNPGQNPDQKDPDEGKQFDYDYVKKLREESKGYRTSLRETETKLTDLEKKVKEFEDAKLTDQEKRDKDLQELKDRASKLEADNRKLKVESAVAKAGAINPERVARLVDAGAEDLDKEIQDVKKEYPTLFRDAVGNGSGDGGSGNGSRLKGSDMNSLLRKAAGRA